MEIIETLHRTLEIEANSEEEAFDIVNDMYSSGEIILTADDFDGDFEINITGETE